METSLEKKTLKSVDTTGKNQGGNPKNKYSELRVKISKNAINVPSLKKIHMEAVCISYRKVSCSVKQGISLKNLTTDRKFVFSIKFAV